MCKREIANQMFLKKYTRKYTFISPETLLHDALFFDLRNLLTSNYFQTQTKLVFSEAIHV